MHLCFCTATWALEWLLSTLFPFVVSSLSIPTYLYFCSSSFRPHNILHPHSASKKIYSGLTYLGRAHGFCLHVRWTKKSVEHQLLTMFLAVSAIVIRYTSMRFSVISCTLLVYKDSWHIERIGMQVCALLASPWYRPNTCGEAKGTFFSILAISSFTPGYPSEEERGLQDPFLICLSVGGLMCQSVPFCHLMPLSPSCCHLTPLPPRHLFSLQ
jgi:hypothetical protein